MCYLEMLQNLQLINSVVFLWQGRRDSAVLMLLSFFSSVIL